MDDTFLREWATWYGLDSTPGKFAHYCYDWDGLPIDETCSDEWESCNCGFVDSKGNKLRDKGSVFTIEID